MVHLADFGLSAKITSEVPCWEGSGAAPAMHTSRATGTWLCFLNLLEAFPHGLMSRWRCSPRTQTPGQELQPRGSGRSWESLWQSHGEMIPCSDGIWLWLEEPGWHRGFVRAAGGRSCWEHQETAFFSSSAFFKCGMKTSVLAIKAGTSPVTPHL